MGTEGTRSSVLLNKDGDVGTALVWFLVWNSFRTTPLGKGLSRHCWRLCGNKLGPCRPACPFSARAYPLRGQGPRLPLSPRTPREPRTARAQSLVPRIYCRLAQGRRGAQGESQRPLGPLGEKRVFLKKVPQGWTLQDGMLTGDKGREFRHREGEREAPSKLTKMCALRAQDLHVYSFIYLSHHPWEGSPEHLGQVWKPGPTEVGLLGSAMLLDSEGAGLCPWRCSCYPLGGEATLRRGSARQGAWEKQAAVGFPRALNGTLRAFDVHLKR